MGKNRKPEPRPIFLGEWLNLFGISRTRAGEVAGCTQSYISNISAGVKPNVNALYLLLLSEEMGINVNDFYRKPPSQVQVAEIARLSPKAQSSIFARKRKKA